MCPTASTLPGLLAGAPLPGAGAQSLARRSSGWLARARCPSPIPFISSPVRWLAGAVVVGDAGGAHGWVMVEVWVTRAEGGVVAGRRTGTAAGVKPAARVARPRIPDPIELEDAA